MTLDRSQSRHWFLYRSAQTWELGPDLGRSLCERLCLGKGSPTNTISASCLADGGLDRISSYVLEVGAPCQLPGREKLTPGHSISGRGERGGGAKHTKSLFIARLCRGSRSLMVPVVLREVFGSTWVRVKGFLLSI